LRFRQQRLQDELTIALRDIAIDLDTTEKLVAIAEQEASQARIMERAEQERFAQGDSDFFLVNRREEATADARIRLVTAQRELHIALTNYQAATLDLAPLGLEDIKP
jgi:hypothetical protein